MLNPQLLKIMIEMQGSENFDENNDEENKPSKGSKRKFIEFQKKSYVTVPIRYNE